MSIQFYSLSSVAFSNPSFFNNTTISQVTKSIKEIASAVLKNVIAFFESFNKRAHNNNMKTFALISCVSLICLLVISMLQRRNTRIIPPPTPQH